MARLFMVLHQDADGVGGDKIVFGDNHNDLISHLLGQYDEIYAAYGVQIEAEDAEAIAYVGNFRNKLLCDEGDVRGFYLTVVGMELQCSDLFEGPVGFGKLVEHIQQHYCADRTLIEELKNSYSDDESLSRVLKRVNERIWCE